MARTSRKQGKAAEQTTIPAMKTALYVRLSNEDNGGRSEDGIDNQLELLLDFIRRLEDMEILPGNRHKPSGRKVENRKDTYMPSGKKVETRKDTSMPSGKKVEIIETYVDNGQTGTDFDRPGWERMMEDAKAGRIKRLSQAQGE